MEAKLLNLPVANAPMDRFLSRIAWSELEAREGQI